MYSSHVFDSTMHIRFAVLIKSMAAVAATVVAANRYTPIKYQSKMHVNEMISHMTSCRGREKKRADSVEREKNRVNEVHANWCATIMYALNQRRTRSRLSADEQIFGYWLMAKKEKKFATIFILSPSFSRLSNVIVVIIIIFIFIRCELAYLMSTLLANWIDKIYGDGIQMAAISQSLDGVNLMTAYTLSQTHTTYFVYTHFALLLSFRWAILSFSEKIVYHVTYDIFKCQTKGGHFKMNTAHIWTNERSNQQTTTERHSSVIGWTSTLTFDTFIVLLLSLLHVFFFEWFCKKIPCKRPNYNTFVK